MWNYVCVWICVFADFWPIIVEAQPVFQEVLKQIAQVVRISGDVLHTRAHARTHASTHTHKRTYEHTREHTRTHAYTRARARTHTHTPYTMCAPLSVHAG